MKKMYSLRIRTTSVCLIIAMLMLSMNFTVLEQSVEAVSSVVSKDWILQNLHNHNVVLLDARSFDEYIGKNVRALKGGHIPGAINIESLYVYDFNGSLKSNNELERMFETAGVTKDKIVVCYCQSGYQAQVEYDVLQTLGYTKLKIYLESWQEWGNDPNTPIDTTCIMALVNGPKPNSVDGCNCGGTAPKIYLISYVYASTFTGIARLIELTKAFANENFTRLSSNFLTQGYIPIIRNFTAVRIISDNGTIIKESIVRTLPYKPITPSDSFVYAVVSTSSNPISTGAVLKENITGKSWTTYYWINRTGVLSTLTLDPCDNLCIIFCLFDYDTFVLCSGWCICAIILQLPYCYLGCAECFIMYLGLSWYCETSCCWSGDTAIRIETTPSNDIWDRYHGFSLDEDLNTDFWNSQPEKVINVTGVEFTWQDTFSLSEGVHVLHYAPSCEYPYYYWHAEIYINDNLVVDGDTGFNQQISWAFSIS